VHVAEAAAGAVAQLLPLVPLGTAHRRGPAGRLAGLGLAGGTWAVLSRALRRARLPPSGPADRVAPRPDPAGRRRHGAGRRLLPRRAPVPLLAGLTTVALLPDGVDGRVARRTGTATPLGTRFGMEVDALLVLVLSGYVSRRQATGCC
jgi:hypothetical protein